MKKTMSFVLVLGLFMVAEVGNADFTFGEPVNLGPPFNSRYGEGGVSISADRLEFYFMSDRPGGYGGYDLWVMKRPTVEEDWASPVNLGSPPNSQYSYWEPCISSDGLSLYFSDGHSPQFGNHLPGGLGGQGDIWVITRPTKLDAWSEPENIGPAVNSEHAVHPSISEDGLSLYFQSHRPGRLGGHCDIMVATRESTSDTFGAPVFLENVNTTGGDWMPDISADGRTLFFSRGPATEIWMARRTGVQDDFDPPVKLPPQINVPSCTNTSPTFSRDGRTLYFCSDRPGGSGGWDLWQVPIEPIVDLNGDGRVDRLDMALLMVNWGTDNSLYDIGPTPFGDGIIDSKDLMVLAEYGAMLAGDVNFDGVVDFLDLAELAKNWLRQQP
jgi:hypothetical protein